MGSSWTPCGLLVDSPRSPGRHSVCSWWTPSGLQVVSSRTPSATWRFLGRFLVLLQPSESSSRLDESSILMVQAFLQSKRSWTAISHLFGLNLDLLDAAWAQLGASWAPLGLNLEPLGRLLGSTWSPWAPLGLNLEPLGRFLGPTRSLLGASWAQLGCLGCFWGPT